MPSDAPPPTGDAERRRPSGLFRRILITFVVTVLGSAGAGAAGAWYMAERASQRWVGHTLEALSDEHDTLLADLDTPRELDQRVASLGAALDARLGIYEARGGRRLAGDGPPFAPHRARRFAARIDHGQPTILRPPEGGPIIVFPLLASEEGRVRAVVVATLGEKRWWSPLLVSGLVTLALLGLGARVLSRSFTLRLGRLERSAERIAGGDLSHRVELDPGPPADEIDDLGRAFNRMADRVQHLLVGQQALLANVSHELRTPIARIKVLLELLEDRVESLAPTIDTAGRGHLERLQRGLADMTRDTQEIESLIADLLTSGRLELRAGEPAGLELQEVEIGALCRTMAERFAADVVVDAPIVLRVDALLVERLLSNLLSNARRACPDGALRVLVSADPERVTLAVEDEGPGIPPEHREAVFEPFTRLDAARSRDRGGVGLGLYLCRQIARAHGGDIAAQARADGRSGARLLVTLSRHLGARPV